MTTERANGILLRELGLMAEEDVAALADVELSTVRDWRKRRTGPPFTHAGRRPLYRIEAVQKWLKSQEKETEA